jgi:hypothetical protein
MCSAAITLTASNLLLGHHLSHQLDRAAHHVQLGLQLGDAALRRGKFGLLGAGQAGYQATVDAVLPPPCVDRLVADPQVSRDVGHRPTRLDQIHHLAPELRRIATPSHATLLQDRVAPESNNSPPENPGQTKGLR